MAYEDYLIREANGEDWPLDRTEATADWYDHGISSGGDPGVHALPEPTSFEEWLTQTGDSL